MKTNKNYIYILLIFFIISINSIYSFSSFLTNDKYELVIRQVLFYVLGIFLIFIINKIKLEKILKYSFYIYIINIILLVLVLFLGIEINGTKAWFQVPLIGTIQPSEFMKIGLILYLAKIIEKSNLKNTKDEIILITKALIITLIPSLITFLEPDTGAVLIYLVICLIMLFTSKIRLRWFIILFTGIGIIGASFLYLYIKQKDLFINIFGSSMFYRLDRIFDWQNSSGMQLENSVISIGASGLFGNGISNILLYFPEGHTDFIFSSFASIYGLTGTIILLITIVWFDLSLLTINPKKEEHKYIVLGTIAALLYQQIQNISMTIGLLPITGITLPFISYGGSSLLSYMILLGIILNIKKESVQSVIHSNKLINLTNRRNIYNNNKPKKNKKIRKSRSIQTKIKTSM